MADNPYAQYAGKNPYAVFSTPAAGPKPPAGYQAIPGGMVAVSGGPEDLATIRNQAGVKAGVQTAAEIAAARAKAAIELDKELKAEREKRAIKDAPAPKTPEQLKAADFQNDNVLNTIDSARGLVNNGWATTGLGNSITSHIPGTSARDLSGAVDTIKANLAFDRLQQMRDASPTGGALGAVSEGEERLLSSTVASLDPTQSKDQILKNLSAIELNYRRLQALNHGEDPSKPDVAKRYGIDTRTLPSAIGSPNVAPPPSGGSGNAPGNPPPASGGGNPPTGDTPGPTGGMTFANGGYKLENDPALAGVNNHVRGMIVGGKSTADVQNYLNGIQSGLGDRLLPDISSQVVFRKQHPDVPADRYSINLENQAIPMSAIGGLKADLVRSPGGAAVLSAANAVTGNALAKLTNNPGLTRAGIDEIQRENPKSSLFGTLAGGGLAAAGLEGIGGIAGLGRFAPIAGDAAYGAATGVGSTDNAGVGDALQGAATGVIGGIAGRGAVRGIGNALTGVRNEAIQTLRDAGVPMTFGQMVSQSGTPGRFLARREDRLAGFGGIGDLINERRLEGFQGFNRAAFDEGLAPLDNISRYNGHVSTNGVVGEQGVDIARDLRSQGYDAALHNVNVPTDAQFGQDFTGAVMAGRGLPDPMAARSDFTLRQAGQQIDPTTGNLDGSGFQQAIRGIRRARNENASEVNGYDLGQVMNQGESAFTNLLDRYAPNVVPDFNTANQVNRGVEVLRGAVNRARNGTRTGETGLFAPSQLADEAAANARMYGNTAGTTDQPFFELTRAGQAVLPSKIGDSGTAGRLEADGGLAAMARSAARNIINAPLYAESTQPVLSSLLLDRPDALVALGNRVANWQRLGGIIGSPLALNYGPAAVGN